MIKKQFVRLFSILLSLCLLCPTTLSVLAEDAQPYSVRVAQNKVDFIRNGQVVGSFDVTSPAQVKLHSNEKKELLVLFRQPDGQYRNITLGDQKQVSLDGSLDRLLLSDTLDPAIGVTLSPTSEVRQLDAQSAGGVTLGGKTVAVTVTGAAQVSVQAGASVSNLRVNNRNAKVSADQKASVAKASSVPGASVKGVSAVKTSGSSAKTGTGGSSGSFGGSSGGSGGGSSSGGGSGGSTPSVPSVSIVGVYPMLAGLRVEFSGPVVLKTEDFRVVCPRGDDMTVLNAKTDAGADENRIYTLSTSYYKNNDFILYVKLPAGTEIEKRFTTNFEAPTLTGGSALRLSGTDAQLNVVSDDLGTLYYLPVPETNTRAAVPQTPTEVKNNGTAFTLKTGMNQLSLTGLTPETAYKVYCASEGVSAKTPVMQPSILVPAVPEDEPSGQITITSAEMRSDVSIKMVLSQATATALTAENISVTCPSQGKLHFNVIETEDRQTYVLRLEPGYFLTGNNTMTLTVTFSDGSTARQVFYADISWPKVSALEITRTDASNAEVKFRSDESGFFYYGTVAAYENEPSAKNAYLQGTKVVLNGGENTLKLANLPSGHKWFYMVTEDAVGNRMEYTEGAAIPDAISEPEKPADYEILTVTTTPSSTQTKLQVKFSKPIAVNRLNSQVDEDAILEVSVVTSSEPISGTLRVTSLQYSTSPSDSLTIYLNQVLPEGTYLLTCKPSGGVQATKTFTYAKTVPQAAQAETPVQPEQPADDQLARENPQPEQVGEASTPEQASDSNPPQK